MSTAVWGMFCWLTALLSLARYLRFWVPDKQGVTRSCEEWEKTVIVQWHRLAGVEDQRLATSYYELPQLQLLIRQFLIICALTCLVGCKWCIYFLLLSLSVSYWTFIIDGYKYESLSRFAKTGSNFICNGKPDLWPVDSQKSSWLFTLGSCLYRQFGTPMAIHAHLT